MFEKATEGTRGVEGREEKWTSGYSKVETLKIK